MPTEPQSNSYPIPTPNPTRIKRKPENTVLGKMEQAGSIIETLRSKRSAMSVSEVASILGVGSRTLYTKVKAGKLPALNVFGSIRLDPAEVADWLESHRA